MNRKRIKQIIATLVLTVLLKVNTLMTYAGGLEGSKLVTGTTNLINDAVRVVQVIGIVVCGCLAGYFAIMSAQAGDNESEKTSWKKAIKWTAIAAVIIIVVPDTLNIIVGYYK